MGYIERNRGYITASKLKTFLTYWPEVYYKQYVEELKLDDDNKDYFILWTALDDLLSYGEADFYKKYALKEKMLKADLEKALNNKGIEFMRWTKVTELESLYYWDKVLLSPSMWEKIIGMYKELKRQPLADLGSEYDTQVELTAEYKGLKLKWTLDRFSKDKSLIRDWKTSWNLNYFEYNLDNTFDYVLSMSFYYILVKLNHSIECDVILDVVGSTPPYAFYSYKLDKTQLFDKIESKILLSQSIHRIFIF